MPCLPRLITLKSIGHTKTMTPITFFVKPGNEGFAPCVSHPGEDAGADIRACVKEDYDRSEAEAFYKKFKKVIGAGGAYDFYIDGSKTELGSLDEFLEAMEITGGAVLLAPGETKVINSGFKTIMSKMDGIGAPWDSLLPVYKIVSRSGLACKHNVVVTNAPGIIDMGYKDWIKVSLTNRGNAFHAFTHGARIAQGLLEYVYDQSGVSVTTDESVFNPTLRELGGFGSTEVA